MGSSSKAAGLGARMLSAFQSSTILDPEAMARQGGGASLTTTGGYEREPPAS
jgi:hypothetical protein